MIVSFIALYVQELGVQDAKQAALWSSMIFGVTHITGAIVSPFWGKLSDKYGKKVMMIRSGIGLSIVVVCMGFVNTPLQLLLMRALFGTVGGFGPASVALIATETPKEEVGNALGTIQTGSVTGSLLGPLLGGVIAELVGMRNSFFVTGLFLFIATVITIVFVKEKTVYEKFQFRRASAPEKPKTESGKKPALGDIVRQSPVILVLYVSTFLIAGSFQSISPVISLYVKQMNIQDHVELMAGIIYASSALGTVIAAPFLGRLGDKHGHMLVLMGSLALLSILYIPQAMITNPWLLMGVRFLSGLCVGGLTPSISSLLRRLTPSSIQGSVFSYNASANSLGNVSGSLFGGIIAGSFGIPVVFYIVAGVFFVHFLMLLPQYGKIGKAAKAADNL